MNLFHRKGKLQQADSQSAPQLEPLTDEERAAIDERVSLLVDWIAAYSPRDVSRKIMPDVLDRTYVNWVQGDPDASAHATAVINALGAGLGNYLAEQLTLEWVVATDRYGRDYAVHGQPNDVLVFPANLIARRFDRKETGFMEPVAKELVQSVRQMRRGSYQA